MSAQLYDPADPAAERQAAIAMTPAARRHVRRQLGRQGARAVLLGVKESGCNGFKYQLSYLESAVLESATPAPDGDMAAARRFDFDDVAVYVENAHWPLLRGTTIDYVTEGLNSALAFDNPNALAACGCGESFSAQ